MSIDLSLYRSVYGDNNLTTEPVISKMNGGYNNRNIINFPFSSVLDTEIHKLTFGNKNSGYKDISVVDTLPFIGNNKTVKVNKIKMKTTNNKSKTLKNNKKQSKRQSKK